MNIKIAHLTSVHPRFDPRIFVKMCSSLAEKQKYDVNLIVADGKGDENINNVQIFDVGKKAKGRVVRVLKTPLKIFRKAEELDCDIYHLHDPELIPIGLKLKKMGKKVIFDAHEDFSRQILGKPYLNKYIAIFLAKIIDFYEKKSLNKFDCIVAATIFIRDRYSSINNTCININNYPIVGELDQRITWSDKKNEVCYIGAISKSRGIDEMVKALRYVEGVRLNLGGRFIKSKLKSKITSYDEWEHVNEMGFLDRDDIKSVLKKSKAGLVVLHPTINYKDALPVKMFEYMAASIPVISSNIPLWTDIVNSNECGVCVDPLNPKEISNAIEYLINNPIEAKKMGENGKNAVIRKFNWSIEEVKLLECYNRLTLVN
jgi:glycosyltransferase involved in cell wall biosynthesis